LQIYPGKNQISADFMYIENIQLIGIYQIIPDKKTIYVAYLGVSVAVKSELQKIWPPTIKKGKSMFQIHPF
jgi:hypothetical protein